MYNLLDVISNVKNPLNDEKTMEKLIDMYEKSERRSYKHNPFYADLVKSEDNGSSSIDRADREKFLIKTYNQWINNVKKIKSEDKDIIKLQRNLSNVGEIKTMKDIENLKDNYLFGKYKEGWEIETNGWSHVKSRYITEKQEKRIKVKHRLYVGCQNQDVWKMADLFKTKCEELKIPYYFKTSESRMDNMVIYADTENWLKYIDILESIGKEHPEIVGRCSKPPMLTGNLDNWIGIGDEPQQEYNNGGLSYNSTRAEIIEDSVEKVLLDDIKKYKGKNINLNGKEISFNKIFLDKATNYIMNSKNIKENPKQIREVLKKNISKGLKKLEQVENKKSDLAKSNIDDIFSIGNIGIDTYDMDKIIKEILPVIRQADSNFKEKVKENMDLRLEKVGIDPKAFCFQKSTIERAKQLEKIEEKKENNIIEKTNKNTEIDKTKVEQENKNIETRNNKMNWIKSFINDYDATEKEYQYETRFAKEDFNMKSVLTSIENNFYAGNMSENINPKLVKAQIGDEFKYEYSQKQVCAMARLLKAADNLTIEGGRNYLEEFTNIPQINSILLQMKKSEYVKEMQNLAEKNRKNQTIPKYQKTNAEQDKRYAQVYLKSGNLSKNNIKEEIEYRQNLLNSNEVMVYAGAKNKNEIPLIAKQKASLERVLARQQGKVPGKVKSENKDGKWTFEVDTQKNQEKDIFAEMIEDSKKITPESITKDTIEANITKQEIEEVINETKKIKQQQISNEITK